jgi:hypothetical protein
VSAGRPDDDRAAARREQQLAEIVTALVEGAGGRAAGLAAEHRQEFPGDAGLLDAILEARSTADRRC